jgi:hypothetical protein
MNSAFRCILFRVFQGLLVLSLSAGSFAQGGAGELSGLVTDPTGAVISGAEVKLTNSATAEVRTTITTGAGTYAFTALPVVGSYTLEIKPKGFKSVRVQNVIVSVGAVTTRDIKLELGATSEQVTVEAGQQIVQTEDSSLSQLVDRRVWENMPLEARNTNDFVNLVAGAVPEQQAGATYRGAAVNGTRTGTGNFMVEGVDNNEQGQGGVAICGTACGQGGGNTSISPEAIEEYRVITHDFAAEFGKAGGFVTDVALKSGTNQWHGSLFEYNRIQALTANDWFSNAAGVRDHLVRNQFGGSVGGPIVKDKTFFYATAEEHRLRETAPVSGTSITQQFYNWVDSGQMAAFVNASPTCNGACTGLPTTLGPIFKSLQARFPLAVPLVNSKINCPSAAPQCQSFDVYGLNNPNPAADPGQLLGAYPVPLFDSITQEQSAPVDQFRFSVKVDHNFSANDRLSGTYLLENVHESLNFGGGDNPFSVPLDNPNKAQTAAITWTHTFSPNLLNQFKIGYVRHTANFFAPGTTGLPETFAADPTTIALGSPVAIPQTFTENQFQYKDDISVTKGKHQLKFGGEYRRTRNQSDFSNDNFGHFFNWGTEDMVTDGVFSDAIDATGVATNFGYPGGFGSWYYAAASVDPTKGTAPNEYRGYRANEVAFYAQDDWRVNSRLTLNLGLRWDYFGPPHNFQPNIDSNVYFGSPLTPFCNNNGNPCTNPDFNARITGNTWFAEEAGAQFMVRNSSIWNKDTNNFAPRLGFAWDTMGNQKLVLRGGFGVFYDRLYNNVFENIRFNAPYYQDSTAGLFTSGTPVGALKDPGLYAVPFTGNAAFAAVPGAKPVPRHMDQNIVNAYYMQESFGLEYQLTKDMALEGNYVGTLGRKLIGIVNRNTFDGRVAGGGSTRPNPIFNSDNARGNYFSSNYNAFNVTLRKRFSHGLSMNANYTYAKALDEQSDVFRSVADGSSFPSPPDVENIRYNYGPADFDIRHRIVVSYNYDLPVFKGNKLLGGWTLNGIVSWNTGSPIGFLDATGPGTDANKDGIRSDRPEFIGSGSVLNAINPHEVIDPNTGIRVYQYVSNTPTGPTSKGMFDVSAACMTNPAISNHGGRWCDPNLQRNSIPGPMFTNIDFGISKTFKINERMGFRFDANFFDLLNHPNFENPGKAGGAGSGGGGNDFGNSAFGQSNETFGNDGGHRVTQLAIRFDF